jgi:hypothetical protein
VATIAVLVVATILLAPYLFELLSGQPNGVAGWVSGYVALPVAFFVASALSAAANAAAAAYWGARGVLLARFAFAGATSLAVLLLMERDTETAH